MGWTWIRLDIPTEKQYVKKDELVSAVNVQWKLCMQEGVCLDGCMFVLM